MKNTPKCICVCNKLEQKNLARQNFVQSDLNKPKAAVLAQRYGRAYGVSTYSILQKVTGETRSLANACESASGTSIGTAGLLQNTLVIICTDSAKSRRDILRTFSNTVSHSMGGQPFIIDSGNEDTFGQVTFFNAGYYGSTRDFSATSAIADVPSLCPVAVEIDAIPADVRAYANMQDRKGTGSCADLDQTLAINAMMATTIISVVQSYFYGMPFTFNTIRLSMDGGNSTSYNTFREIAGRIYEESSYDIGFLNAFNLPLCIQAYGQTQTRALNGEPENTPVKIVVTCDPDDGSIRWELVEPSGFSLAGNQQDVLQGIVDDMEGIYPDDFDIPGFTDRVRAIIGMDTVVEVVFE